MSENAIFENETENTNAQPAQEDSATVEKVYTGALPSENREAYVEVEATATKKEGEQIAASIFYPFGTNLEDAVARYGQEVVFTNFRAQAKIKLQALMRTRLLKGQPVQELVDKWKPGIQMERVPVDPIVAAESAFDTMNASEQEAFLQRLIEKQKQG